MSGSAQSPGSGLMSGIAGRIPTLRISMGLLRGSWSLGAAVLFLPGCMTDLSYDSADLSFNTDVPPTRPATTEAPRISVAPLFEAIDGKSNSHAATLTAFPDGELLAAWYSYSGDHELDNSAIYTARRLPGESTWSTPAKFSDHPQGDGNPVLYSEGDHVWFFQAVVAGGWSTARVVWRESTDRGGSWSAERPIDGPIGTNVRFAPLRTAANDLLLPAYDDLLKRTLFFAWTGSEWEIRSTIWMGINDPSIQPAVVRLDNGNLLAVMRHPEHRWLWATSSRDDGHSWTKPIDSGFPNYDTSAAMIRLSSGALVLAFAAPDEPDHPLYATISADEGLTWLPPRVLISGEGIYNYPSMTQTPDGIIHLLYTHDRAYIGHIELNEGFFVQ